MFERDVKQGEEVLGRCRRRIPDFGHECADFAQEPRLTLVHWRQVGVPGPRCVDSNSELMVFVFEFNPLFVQGQRLRDLGIPSLFISLGHRQDRPTGGPHGLTRMDLIDPAHQTQLDPVDSKDSSKPQASAGGSPRPILRGSGIVSLA